MLGLFVRGASMWHGCRGASDRLVRHGCQCLACLLLLSVDGMIAMVDRAHSAIGANAADMTNMLQYMSRGAARMYVAV